MIINEESNEGLILLNDDEGASKVIELLDNHIYNCDNTISDNNRNIWIDNYKKIENYLKSFYGTIICKAC